MRVFRCIREETIFCLGKEGGEDFQDFQEYSGGDTIIGSFTVLSQGKYLDNTGMYQVLSRCLLGIYF